MLRASQLAIAVSTVAMHRLFSLMALALLLFTLITLAAGERLSHAAPRTIGAAPADLPVQTIALQTPANQSVAGWFVKGHAGRGVVLLLHGIRGNRTSMLARTRFLHKAGYSVLLVDLPAHGESSGTRITFGLHEADAVNAALAYLNRQFPGKKIAVIGVSLGAASLTFANTSTPLSAVVLESMYPTITEAVVDRLKIVMGSEGGYIAPLLLWQLPLWTDATPDKLQPIAKLPSLHAPVLIASGSEDRHTTLAETQRLFQAANNPKELWIVNGALHQDLHAYTPNAYETRILEFLAKHLPKTG